MTGNGESQNRLVFGLGLALRMIIGVVWAVVSYH